MQNVKLNATEREFFRMVRLAIGANPFSDERAAIDSRLTQSKTPLSNDKQIKLLIAVVEKQLRKTCAGVEKPVLQFQGEDRELVQYGILFLIYHKSCARFDQHIQEQIHNGDAPCGVAFADEVLAEMRAMGIAQKEAVRFFSLFFQMRRAFYFIDQIVGRSPCMKNLRRNLWNNIFTHDIWLYDQYLWNRMEDFSTMLLGATGTGKGLAAAAIGRSGYISYDERKKCFSESFTRVFVSINLSQYPEQLVESELFGHKKGAFTGAIDGHEGIFTLCSPAGAIFLDEIGEVSTHVQIKLLQVLQERLFSPVGSHKKERFYGRVIAATNRSIEELRSKKMFRDDFYYRLCSDIIHVPSLRERIRENPEELDDLLAHTVRRIVGKTSPELVLNTLQILKKQIPPDYPWPGNVRELEQGVRRILLKQQYEGDQILSGESKSDTFEEMLAERNLTAQQLMARYCKELYKKLGTYEAVAKQTELDRRTVKKYIDS
ncbi:MAG: sigma-54-dependent Fis family transcriptional regulator [Desulforudis sp.]|nr:MAG: sigma-54-dependent Fis family transcriptional regulator [Desulforudis sp.]